MIAPRSLLARTDFSFDLLPTSEVTEREPTEGVSGFSQVGICEVPAEERLLQWLCDAHAMEGQAKQMFARQSDRLRHYPLAREMINAQALETERKAERLERCIARRGGSVSDLNSVTARLLAMAQGLTGMFTSDVIFKVFLSSYTFAQMEIASYRILIAAAEKAADLETKRTCEQNLAEAQSMATWMDDNLDSLTGEYLQREPYPQSGR